MFQPFLHKAAVPALLSALLLTACGADQGAAKQEAASGPALETIVVATGDADGERLFDGVVEAVQQATLAAQTPRPATAAVGLASTRSVRALGAEIASMFTRPSVSL